MLKQRKWRTKKYNKEERTKEKKQNKQNKADEKKKMKREIRKQTQKGEYVNRIKPVLRWD